MYTDPHFSSPEHAKAAMLQVAQARVAA